MEEEAASTAGGEMGGLRAEIGSLVTSDTAEGTRSIGDDASLSVYLVSTVFASFTEAAEARGIPRESFPQQCPARTGFRRQMS